MTKILAECVGSMRIQAVRHGLGALCGQSCGLQLGL